jgi:serine/threonine-protein kinase
MAAGPGDVLRGRFEIRRILGGGRSSDVFAAFDRERKCEVALRVLRPELARNPDARDRFFHAANSFVVVEHAGLVPVYGVFEEGERCFAALELLAGVSLADEMRARPVSAGGYPVEDAFRVGGVLCAALQRLHTVIAHGDVRPENVWIGRHGETRLLDPGLVAPPGARLAWPPGDLEAAVWTSPEVLKGHPPDALSDQWSLAAILYRMLGGEPPVGRAPPLRALRREVPDAAARAIDRALSVRPGDRFLTMSALAEGMGDGDSTAGRLLRRLLGRGRAPKPEAPG